MKYCMWVAMLWVAATIPALGLELVTNGDFEEDLTDPWVTEYSGSGTVTRGTAYDEDPDYEVRVLKSTGTGYARLSQTVPIPSLDVVFSVNARLQADATVSAWAVAAVEVDYLDEDGTALGTTSISVRSRYCPWESTPTLHLIDPDPDVWMNHSFRVDEELAYLPGVDPLRVSQLQIRLLGLADDC